jgi:hypothetical protein
LYYIRTLRVKKLNWLKNLENTIQNVCRNIHYLNKIINNNYYDIYFVVCLLNFIDFNIGILTLLLHIYNVTNHSVDKIKNNEMGEPCGTYGDRRDFGGETRKKDAI